MERNTARRAAVTVDEESGSTRSVNFKGPPSGVRLKAFSAPLQRIRQLARRAESVGLDLVAFELLFVAARIESGRQVEVVRSELSETADGMPEAEARFYRGAVRSLAAATMTD
jgi:hypothetical protein